jgi:hypothetical protein
MQMFIFLFNNEKISQKKVKNYIKKGTTFNIGLDANIY